MIVESDSKLHHLRYCMRLKHMANHTDIIVSIGSQRRYSTFGPSRPVKPVAPALPASPAMPVPPVGPGRPWSPVAPTAAKQQNE